MKNELENNLNILISFRSVEEVSYECLKYVDILDLKNPDKGAIGSWEIRNYDFQFMNSTPSSWSSWGSWEIKNYDFELKNLPEKDLVAKPATAAYSKGVFQL